MTVEQLIKSLQEPLFDSAIVKHGFASFFRDYDVFVQIRHFQFLYRFTHCTSATITTAMVASRWQKSWDEIYTNYDAWQKAGSPGGYVWGNCYFLAYPGATYVSNSTLAREWTERLGKPMHEVSIETNVQNLNLIFHDLIVRELKEGDKEWVMDPVKR